MIEAQGVKVTLVNIVAYFNQCLITQIIRVYKRYAIQIVKPCPAHLFQATSSTQLHIVMLCLIIGCSDTSIRSISDTA